MLIQIAQHLVRALHLVALALAPRALSPEPLPSPHPAVPAALAGLLFGVVLFGAVKLASLMGTREALIAAVLAWIAVPGCIGAAWLYQGDGAPLARAVPIVALPVWGTLSATAAALAGYFLGSSWKNKRMGAVIIVLGLGTLQLTKAAPYLGSHDQMWRAALHRDPAHEMAFEKVTPRLLREGKDDELRKLSDRCLAVSHACCPCLEIRAGVALRQRALQDAQKRAADAVSACPDRALSRAIAAEAAVLAGDAPQGLRQAQEALALGREEGRLRYVMALAHDRLASYADATREAQRAVELGAGRDAKLLAGSLSIRAGDLDGAERFLRPLAEADPADVDVVYELAVIAEQRGQLDAALRGYLAALRLDGKRPEVHYRLARLSWKREDRQEARRQAREFIERWPADPHALELADLVGIARPNVEGAKPP